jgi:flagellar biosynthetic protein FliO
LPTALKLPSIVVDAPSTSTYVFALLQTLVVLAVVCVLAWYVLRWGARRMGGISTNKTIEVLEATSLDVRNRLFLVRVRGKILLLGAGEHGVTALHEFADISVSVRETVASAPKEEP